MILCMICAYLSAEPFVMNSNNGRYLGNSHLSYPSISTAFFNPSILPQIGRTGITFAHQRMFADVYQSGLLVALKLNSGDFVSLGFQELTAPDQDLYSDYGQDPDGTFSFYIRNFAVSYTHVIKKFAFSGTLHYHDERYWTTRSGYPYLNVNASVHHNNMTISFGVYNLGPKHTYEEESRQEPIQMICGAGYHMKNHYFITEFFYKQKEEYSVTWGHEIGIGDAVAFGYGMEGYKSTTGEWFLYPTVGGRVGTGAITVDYSFVYKNSIMMTHQLGLTVYF